IGMNQKEIWEFLIDLESLSWDGTGRSSACITAKCNNGMYSVLGYGYNRVLPYEGYMLYEGSLREKNHTPVGQNLEYGETVHAEIDALLMCNLAGAKITDSILWTSKFCCPYCARSFAASPISAIFYRDEYTNDLSYSVLRAAGKVIKKVL
ncbi:MAG TPA: hypothetical protein ENN64_00745, partial [bacterium]|nr:hypothetical protein [bacterium]